MDEDVLAPRTSCLFYFTKPDLYMKRSIKYAEMAQEIAKSNSFKTERSNGKGWVFIIWTQWLQRGLE